MNNSASASRRTWNRVMNALVWASAVLVIVLDDALSSEFDGLKLVEIIEKGVIVEPIFETYKPFKTV